MYFNILLLAIKVTQLYNAWSMVMHKNKTKAMAKPGPCVLDSFVWLLVGIYNISKTAATVTPRICDVFFLKLSRNTLNKWAAHTLLAVQQVAFLALFFWRVHFRPDGGTSPSAKCTVASQLHRAWFHISDKGLAREPALRAKRDIPFAAWTGTPASPSCYAADDVAFFVKKFQAVVWWLSC